jgi:hypothetical protein
MTPFQQFRVWFRRTNIGSRVLTVLVAAVVASAGVWFVLPQGAAEQAAGFPTSGATGGNAAGECVEGTTDGLTADEVSVAVTIVALPSVGNESVGVPSPKEQEEDFQVAADAINAAGGAGCRDLVLSFHRVNPIDPNATQAACLDIVAEEPFIALDTGALSGTGAADCIPKAKIALASFGGSVAQLEQYYPYFLKPAGTIEQSLRNGVLAWDELGYLDAEEGFEKLGVITKSCNPPYNETVASALEEVGLTTDQIVTYDLGCPFGAATTADLKQAVLAFKSGGVTAVTEVDSGPDFAGFTKVAAAQDFEPRYLLADDGLLGIAGGSIKLDADNADGAINVGSTRYGEETTPGFESEGATKECNDAFLAQGKEALYDQPAGYGGIACGLLEFVKAAVGHLPEADRASLVNGLHDIGTLDLPYPQGPVDFAGTPAGTPYAANQWRVLTFHGDCECWQVDDPAFNPPFS